MRYREVGKLSHIDVYMDDSVPEEYYIPEEFGELNSMVMHDLIIENESPGIRRILPVRSSEYKKSVMLRNGNIVIIHPTREKIIC